MGKIVTIDGPAGSGKSTAARGLAARLGFHFLDTGAMYRVVALKCLEEGIRPDDSDGATRIAASLAIRALDEQIQVDGVDVTAAIRTPEVTRAASIVAQIAEVRTAMVKLQRKVAEDVDIVSEGRDQGTVVFPDAPYKFFLIADPQERAFRRHREFKQQGTQVGLNDMLDQIRDRDRRDENRDASPLKKAPDAIEVDTTKMTSEEVLDFLECNMLSPGRGERD